MTRIERQKLQKKLGLFEKEINGIFLGLGGNIMIFCILFFFTIPTFIHIGIGLSVFVFAFLGIVVSFSESESKRKMNYYRRKLNKKRYNFHTEMLLDFVLIGNIDKAMDVHNFINDNISDSDTKITRGLVIGMCLNDDSVRYEMAEQNIKLIREELKK
jgi:hypothetical protein